VILRPDCAATQLMHLTCAAAVAMCDAVEDAADVRPGIKWINDLVVGNKKLGGILTELSLVPGSDRVEYAVIGIGINCCQTPADFPEEIRGIATSLLQITEKAPDRAALSAAMIRKLREMDSRLFSQKNALMDTYRKNCITLGQDVLVLRGEEKRYGTALDVDADGGLVVQFCNGTTQTVDSGEVSVRGMYGYV